MKPTAALSNEGSHQIQNLWNLCDGQILYCSQSRQDIMRDKIGIQRGSGGAGGVTITYGADDPQFR
jgi:hypothetical protein